MFVSPGDKLYEGMIIGIHSRENDLVVNPIKGKQLTNVRASGTDEAMRLVPPVQLSLESAVEFIAEDELVELTPKSIRLRKRFLTEIERKRAPDQAIRNLKRPAGFPVGRFFVQSGLAAIFPRVPESACPDFRQLLSPGRFRAGSRSVRRSASTWRR
jgi:hypothetical protein